ncbi:unnamed protein product [Rhizoctonia solani]|uniref:WD40 repeat-like protein n=1 Tax=Rhizoctonia solani TaxID=456999 RepID=A0A8H3H6M7_9AGAM|nr:unnamed protein product [Rhizoctonia solani]
MSHPGAGTILCLAFSPDGMCVASGGSDKAIWVWGVHSGQPVLGPLTVHTNSITSLVYSHTGSYIISGSRDCSVRVWSANSGKIAAAPVLGHTGYITFVAISPDDTEIISCDSVYLRVWNVQSGCLVFNQIVLRGIFSAAVSSNGKLIVTSSHIGRVYVWEAQTGQAVASLYYGPTTPCSVGISPNNIHILLGFSDGTIQIWDLNSNKARHSAVSGKEAIEFSMDGATLFTGYGDGTVHTWNAKTGQLVSSIQPPFPLTVSTFVFSADLLHNVVVQKSTPSSTPTMHRRITQTGEPTHGTFREHIGYISSQVVDFSPDGTRIVSGSGDKAVYIWDAHSGVPVIGPLMGHTSWINSVAYSPDGGYVASSSNDGTIRIWDANTQPPYSSEVGIVVL